MGMGYATASKSEVESVMPEEYGGMWFLKEALDTEHLGVTVLEMEPGAKGKRHSHEGDGQEEVYVVVEGEVTVDLGGDAVTLGGGEAIRIDPGTERQIHNDGDVRAKLVLAGAPL